VASNVLLTAEQWWACPSLCRQAGGDPTGSEIDDPADRIGPLDRGPADDRVSELSGVLVGIVDRSGGRWHAVVDTRFTE